MSMSARADSPLKPSAPTGIGPNNCCQTKVSRRICEGAGSQVASCGVRPACRCAFSPENSPTARSSRRNSEATCKRVFDRRRRSTVASTSGMEAGSRSEGLRRPSARRRCASRGWVMERPTFGGRSSRSFGAHRSSRLCRNLTRDRLRRVEFRAMGGEQA
jgi:hypothetical protein